MESKTKRIIGNKETLAEFCWEVMTAGRDPEIYNEVTDNLLTKAKEMANAAGYDKPCPDAMRYLAEHCWKEGFISSMAAMEYGVFERIMTQMPQGAKGGLN